MTRPTDVLGELRDAVPGQVFVSAAPAPSAPSPRFASTFPRMAELLGRAERFEVRLEDGAGRFVHRWGRRRRLLSWSGGSMGWLSTPPGSTRAELHPEHLLVLTALGGLSWSWGGPPSYLLNLEHAFDPEKATVGFWEGQHEVDYLQSMCATEWASLGIAPHQLVCFAREWNANQHLYHRETLEVLCFAPDPGWGMKRRPGFPEQTIYELPGAATFRDWVETVAATWLERM